MNSSPGILEKLFIKTGFKKPPVGKERRRSKRYRVELPIQFRVFLRSRPEISTSFHPARLFDISEHGLGMLIQTIRFDGLHITKLDAKTSEECLLEIQIPFDPEPLVLKGRMIWYIQTPEYDPYILRVGVSLVDMSPDQKKKLLNFIGICVHANEINT
jgi:hypothetical protein